MARKTRREMRLQRHRRVRVKVRGTATCPRLAVYRSNKHMYAQLIDDEAGKTLMAVSTVDKTTAEKAKGLNGVDQAKLVGETLGEQAASREIKEVVFDRGGFTYGGRIKALADGARAKGLKF